MGLPYFYFYFYKYVEDVILEILYIPWNNKRIQNPWDNSIIFLWKEHLVWVIANCFGRNSQYDQIKYSTFKTEQSLRIDYS